MNHYGTGASLLFELVPTSFCSHFKCRRLDLCCRVLRLTLTVTTGSLTNPPTSELHAINLSLRCVLMCPELFRGYLLLIASDSLSCILALLAGPLRPFVVAGPNYVETWDLLLRLARICQHVYLHFIPSQVGIAPNEQEDEMAKCALATFTLHQQHMVPLTLPLVHRHLKRTFTTQWL